MTTELLQGKTLDAVAGIRTALRAGARVYANGRDDPNGPGTEVMAVSVRKAGLYVRTVRGDWLAPGEVWTEEEEEGQ